MAHFTRRYAANIACCVLLLAAAPACSSTGPKAASHRPAGSAGVRQPGQLGGGQEAPTARRLTPVPYEQYGQGEAFPAGVPRVLTLPPGSKVLEVTEIGNPPSFIINLALTDPAASFDYFVTSLATGGATIRAADRSQQLEGFVGRLEAETAAWTANLEVHADSSGITGTALITVIG